MIELKINKNTENALVRKYDLVQYTHHIHFQGEQEGSCLRVSEVKPKLDRFIRDLEKKGKLAGLLQSIGVSGDTVPSDWKMENQDEKKRSYALKYKMSVQGFGKKITPDSEVRHTAFFGNMGSRTEKKQFVFCEKGLALSIISADEKLLCFLDEILPAFFLLNCFGTRSTKGFGSYGIKGKEYGDPGYDNAYLARFVDALYYLKDSRPCNEKLQVIKTLSNMMKGGINQNGYYKGRIFYYFKNEKNMGSDKAFVKQNVLTGFHDKNFSEEKEPYSAYVYSRAMLGLAERFEYRSGPNTDRKGLVTVEDAKKTIRRFNNPVHFLPRPNGILILPTDIPQIMKDRKFVFRSAGKAEKVISTPKEFDLVAFLDYFAGQYNDRIDLSPEKNLPKELRELPQNEQIIKIV